MQRQRVRVMVASEYPEVRYLLKEALERTGEGVVVGQAQDSVTALALSRNLRPDVVLIDSSLPHGIRLDSVPPLRMAGLDTAQEIAKEIPNTRIVVLSDLDEKVLPEYVWTPDKVVLFSRKSGGTSSPFTLSQLCEQELGANQIVLANINVQSQLLPQQKVSARSDKAIFFGILAIAGGWLITLTVFLAPLGIAVALIGATSVLLGLGMKLTTGLWRRAQRQKPSPPEAATKS